MSRRWIYDPSRPAGQRMVPVPLDYKPKPRPRLAVHGVKPAFQSMADGRWYDDARTYEREVRAMGYEIVGNEPVTPHSKAFPEDDTVRDDLISTCREYGISIEGRFPDGA